MKNRKHTHTAFVLMLALVWAALCPLIFAKEVESPFERPKVVEAPKQNTTPAPNPLDHMEFDGYMSMQGKTMISLYDRKERRSYWVELNTKNQEGFEVSNFQQGGGNGDSVLLRHGGKSKSIQLKNSDILTLATPAAPTNSNANSNRKTPARASANNNIAKESDEEVRERMKRVAEEIRRRRAMRRSLVDGKENQDSSK
ncbi:hypothetical protein MLD52_13245 [Puniceicoccaceae bacterium K14]|nr:hypothetical protein [Puniceicoccaceae bacterium K14]